MESDLKQIGNLLRLLEERDNVVDALTAQILDTLRPTLLNVLCELFGQPYDDVDWLDVQCVDTVLLVICAIRYNPEHSTAYLNKLFAHSVAFDTIDGDLKMIRIGIPVALAFGPIEDIVKFLHEAASDAITEKIETTVETSSEISDNNAFDTSKLSAEQLQQLSLFTNNGKGAKH